MADPAFSHAPQPAGATGVLVLADGHVAWGQGFGATGTAVGEVCFNTAMTGYQEVMTDPSYAGQIVTFTFPHIGNVGVNDEDLESLGAGRGGLHRPGRCYRAVQFPRSRRVGRMAGGTRQDRLVGNGYPRAHPAHSPVRRAQCGDRARPRRAVRHAGAGDAGAGLAGAAGHGPGQGRHPRARCIRNGRRRLGAGQGLCRSRRDAPRPHVVAIDYGAKDNIFRNLVKAGARVTVVPAKSRLMRYWRLSPPAYSCPTAPAIRRRRATMRCR